MSTWMSSKGVTLIQAEESETISVWDLVELVLRHGRQPRAGDRVVDARERIERFLRRCDREIRAEQQLMQHAPFGRMPEGVVAGPRTIKIRGDVSENVGMLADYDKALDLPGVAHVRQNHPQFWERDRDRVDVSRVGVIQLGELHGRRPGVKQDRQTELLRAAEDAVRLFTQWMEVLVIGPEFDSAHAELVDATVELVERVRIMRVDSKKPNQLLGIGAHDRGGVVVHFGGSIDELTVLR